MMQTCYRLPGEIIGVELYNNASEIKGEAQDI